MAAPEPKPSNRRAREYDIAQDIGFALTHTTRAYQRALNAELAPYGVTIRQSRVLGWLRKKGDLSPSELARLLAIEPATLAGVLERMERDGLIRRLLHASDHRRKLIRLTGRSERLRKKLIRCATVVSAPAIQGLSAEELDTLYVLLKRVTCNLAEALGE